MTKPELSSCTQKGEQFAFKLPRMTRGSFSPQHAKQTKASKLQINTTELNRLSKVSLQQGQPKHGLSLAFPSPA